MRGYARFMLAVWAGGGAQAASCLVILQAYATSADPLNHPGVRYWAILAVLDAILEVVESCS